MLGYPGTAASLAATNSMKVTMRGPQREAMSSSRPSIWLALTAFRSPPTLAGRDRGRALASGFGVSEEDHVGVRLSDVFG